MLSFTSFPPVFEGPSHQDGLISADVRVGADVIEGYVRDNVVSGAPSFQRHRSSCCWCRGHGSRDEMRIATVVWGAAAVRSLLNAAWPRGWMLTLAVSQPWAGRALVFRDG